MRYFCFFLVFVFLVSCSKFRIKTPAKTELKCDTLHLNQSVIYNTDACRNAISGYYKRFGVVIPKYYTVQDSLPIDLNNDRKIDTLVVLSPITLEDVETSDCISNIIQKRLLVEIINKNGKSRIGNIYSNLLSDAGGVLSTYNGIYKTKKGFAINNQKGARYSLDYTMEFVPNTNGNLKLFKITKICSYDGRKKKMEYLYKNFEINTINFDFNDSIKVNCDCDSAWQELENR